jgi:formylglycine-generating enzyme required for sulfatase activity
MGRIGTVEKLMAAFPGLKSDAEIATEEPAHLVEISRPFYIGTTHVTVSQYRTYVRDAAIQTPENESHAIVPFPAGWKEEDRPWVKLNFPASDEIIELSPEGSGWGRRKGATWVNVGFPQTDSDPVVNVSWCDAIDFCRWLSKRHRGSEFRLPSEAEWEYACRAGKQGLFFWGDDVQRASVYCNGADDVLAQALQRSDDLFPGNSGYLNTSPVKAFKANAWGLFDMLGNASQWCADHADGSAYTKKKVKDPHVMIGDRRVVRGGNWYRGPQDCRCAARRLRRPAGRSCLTGFRVVMEIPVRRVADDEVEP